MKKIKTLVCWMEDELKSAQEYAEKYVECKVSNNSSWASKFKDMSSQELSHAANLHQYVSEEIMKYSAVFQPPQKMYEKWQDAHKGYMEKAAWIKQMLDM